MIDNLLSYLKNFFHWLLNPLWDFIQYVVYFFWDLFCTLIESIVSAIHLPASLLTNFMHWSGLPEPLLYVLNAIGLEAGLTMVSAALLIRVTLNLIPGMFTRL